MNILIIGGAGFLGSNLVRRCLQDPSNRVTVLDSLEPRLRTTSDNLQEVWKEIRFVRGSMADEPLIAELVQDQDVIFNCAAQTSHPLSLQDPLFDAEINCIGNLRLLEAIRLLNKSATVVYTSSSTVIGKAIGDIVDETHGEKPLDIYSANKGVAEKYYRIYNRVHDLRTVVLRFANLYGPFGKGFPEFGFVNYFIHQARNGQEIRIFGSGHQRRNVLYAEDATEILYLAAQNSGLIGEVFFATHEEHLTVLEMAQAIVAEFGQGQINNVEWPDERRRIEIESVCFSSRRLRSLIAWKPQYSFAQGIARTRMIMLHPCSLARTNLSISRPHQIIP